MISKRSSRVIGLVLALAVIGAGTGVVLAATSTGLGKAQTQIKVVRENAQTATFSSKSTAYSDIPNATTLMTVPAGTNALLVARFQAHGSVIQAAGCMARIVVGGTVMEPNGNYPIWGQSSVSESLATGGSIERSLAVGPGTYTVKAQMRVSALANASSECQLTGWHLAVERHKR